MINTVGAFLAQRQPFCRYATFPLIGESPVCPPGKYRQHFLYSRRGDPRGLPFHVVCDVELTAARAVTTLKNKRFRCSCRGVHCTPADRKRIFPKINRYDRTARLMRADTRVRPYNYRGKN